MSDHEPRIYLARHGETAWSLSGQHTGLTDLPLTAHGEDNARRLGERLAGLAVKHVFVSPLKRARRTCELAGFAAAAKVEPDLVEWNYGRYEGLKSAEIQELDPGWIVFRDGCPGGESVADVRSRAERLIAKLRDLDEPSLLFSSGHILRLFTACWLELPSETGTPLHLDTASLSIVGYHRSKTNPVLRLWNCRRHLEHDDS